jgi:hypothetical protein
MPGGTQPGPVGQLGPTCALPAWACAATSPTSAPSVLATWVSCDDRYGEPACATCSTDARIMANATSGASQRRTAIVRTLVSTMIVLSLIRYEMPLRSFQRPASARAGRTIDLSAYGHLDVSQFDGGSSRLLSPRAARPHARAAAAPSSISTCASVGWPPLISVMSCGQAERTRTRSISALSRM